MESKMILIEGRIKSSLLDGLRSILGLTDQTAPRSRQFKVIKNMAGMVLAVDEKELVDGSCIKILEKINPTLIQQYIGAARAASGDNPDRTRHTFISMRTMWEQILSKIAPSKQATKWLKDNGFISGEYIDKDRATKFGRLYYAFRNQLTEMLEGILIHQIKAINKFLKKLNKVHKSALSLTKKKLKSFFLLGNSQLSSLRTIFA